MSESVESLGPFRGQWSAVDGEAPRNFAGSTLNVRVGDGHIRPRYGFRNLAGKPSGLVSVHGLNRVIGYGDDYASRIEWVSIENRGGTVKPYSIDPSDWSRTAITNGGTPLSLNGGEWRGFSYDSDSYWINPGADPSLYKHEVGNVGSWDALQDSAYVPPVDSPALTVHLSDIGSRPFDGTDTFSKSAGSHVIKSVTFAVNADGALEVSGQDDNDPGTIGSVTIQTLFASSLDLSGQDYVAIEATAGKILKVFQTGSVLKFKVAGSWVTPEQKEFRAADLSSSAVVARLKGGSYSAVDGIQLTLRANPEDPRTGLGFTISPLAYGGTYIGATSAGHRVWDATYDKADVTYGVRYHNIGAGTYTGILQSTKDRSVFGTLSLGPSSPLGDVVNVSATPDLQAPFTDDPTGASYAMELLRLDADGKWRIVATFPNTTGQALNDPYELNELPSLVEATGSPYVPPDPAPVFSSVGFVAGIPFKGWVVWLKRGGYQNVQHSRVGNPEALSSAGDDPDDVARGATFSLADDFADEPVGGVQAGDAVIVAGREGVYAQAGNSPSTMTPPRKLPGSMGCAGYLAYARYRDEVGNPGMAWLDPTGENVWFASAGLVYSTDTQARPVEVSAPIRGSLRAFLYDAQRESLPDLAVSQARMDVDEATGSLWVVLGSRAAVLRPPSLIDGQRQWELYDYALGDEGEGVVSVCGDPFGGSGATSAARTGSDAAWTNPTGALGSAGSTTCGPLAGGQTTEWLTVAGFLPPTLFPAEGTLTSLTAIVRHRFATSETYQVGLTLDTAELWVAGSMRSSISPGTALTGSYVDTSLSFPLNGTVLDEVNGGTCRVRLGYSAGSSGSASAGFGLPGDHAALPPPYWVDTLIDVPSGASIAGTASGSIVWGGSGTNAGPGGDPSYPAFPPPGGLPLATGKTAFSLVFKVGAAGTDPGFNVSGALQGGTSFSLSTLAAGRLYAGFNDVCTNSMGAAIYPSPFIDNTGSFAIALTIPKAPSTAEVDSILLRACYDIPQAEGERGVSYLAFGPDRYLVWLRSSGHLDSVEWCPTCVRYVEGSSRDGGLPMPEGLWESARLSGFTRRLTRVDCERDGFEAIVVSDRTERLTAGESRAIGLGFRWTRFSPRAQGRTHRIRFSVPESLTGVESVDMVFTRTEGPGR